jgi:Lrp/AsnC family transcriptional regulator for asnA, asnC and gidA
VTPDRPGHPVSSPHERGVDDSDRRIAALLGEDGRASYAAIAEKVGLSDDAVRARIQRMTEAGVLRIRGFVHPSALGLHALASAGLRTSVPVRAAVDGLRAVDGVTFVAETLGRHALLVDVAAADDAALLDVLDRVAGVPGVMLDVAWRHLTVAKWESQVHPRIAPASEASAPRDDIDLRLVRVLVDDPRASFATLAERTGISYAVARRRSLRLFQDGVVVATAVLDRVSSQQEVRAQLGLVLVGERAGALRELSALEGVKVLVTTTGRENAIAEVRCADHEALEELVERAMAVPGVAAIETWLFARLAMLPMPWRFTPGPIPLSGK